MPRARLLQLRLQRPQLSNTVKIKPWKWSFTVPGPDELDLIDPYKRPRLIHETDEELSDYVKVRLLLARLAALKLHEEKWG